MLWVPGIAAGGVSRWLSNTKLGCLNDCHCRYCSTWCVATSESCLDSGLDWALGCYGLVNKRPGQGGELALKAQRDGEAWLSRTSSGPNFHSWNAYVREELSGCRVSKSLHCQKEGGEGVVWLLITLCRTALPQHISFWLHTVVDSFKPFAIWHFRKKVL